MKKSIGFLLIIIVCSLSTSCDRGNGRWKLQNFLEEYAGNNPKWWVGEEVEVNKKMSEEFAKNMIDLEFAKTVSCGKDYYSAFPDRRVVDCKKVCDYYIDETGEYGERRRFWLISEVASDKYLLPNGDNYVYVGYAITTDFPADYPKDKRNVPNIRDFDTVIVVKKPIWNWYHHNGKRVFCLGEYYLTKKKYYHNNEIHSQSTKANDTTSKRYIDTKTGLYIVEHSNGKPDTFKVYRSREIINDEHHEEMVRRIINPK